ncbi:hypothetical protein glysoja_046198 [Glycine soja]|uniref:Uncharacterized protein n=1 Tax=Glycine soja TaxID=3848 RepID=A0A0B2QUA6_GLYSO|nr:hypothetical protein glysoja_046198 [Glycine soja]
MFYGTTTQQSQALKWFVEVITYYQDWARAKAVQHNATRLGDNDQGIVVAVRTDFMKPRLKVSEGAAWALAGAIQFFQGIFEIDCKGVVDRIRGSTKEV